MFSAVGARPPSLLVTATRVSQSGDCRELVESRHYGHLVVVGPDGQVAGALGDPNHVTFVRSTAKPFQAAASLALAGDPELPSALLAVSWSSHRGEPAQLEAVRDLLTRAGLTTEELTTPPTEPAHDPTRPPTRLAHNCSGKHALFALAGRAVGCPRSLLLDPDGPVQRSVLATLADAIGPPSAVSVDGCGAPAVAGSLVGLARGYAALAAPDDRWARVAEAGRAHPNLVGGNGRLESALLADGIVAKPGAEGVFAAGWASEGGAWAAALKVTDGASRGSSTALHGLLTAAGIVAAEAWSPPAVLGGGRPVGRVAPAGAVTALGAALSA